MSKNKNRSAEALTDDPNAPPVDPELIESQDGSDDDDDDGFHQLTHDFEGWYVRQEGGLCQGVILARIKRPTEVQPNGRSYIVRLTRPCYIIKPKQGEDEPPALVPAKTIICVDESKALEVLSGCGQYPGEYECKILCKGKKKVGSGGKKGKSFWDLDVKVKQIAGHRRPLPTQMASSREVEDEDEDFTR